MSERPENEGEDDDVELLSFKLRIAASNDKVTALDRVEMTTTAKNENCDDEDAYAGRLLSIR